jgi:peptidoglycan-associated lipoprotein
MRLKIIALTVGLLALGACSSTPEPPPETAGSGSTAPMATGPMSTGVGSAPIGSVRPGTQEDLVANVGDRVFFDFDKYTLSPDGRRQVEAWGEWLKRFPSVPVTIEGHADERGTREYNLALGERRAISARDYLIAQGVNPSRIRTVSYGKERPAELGSNESAYARNRRAVLIVS